MSIENARPFDPNNRPLKGEWIHVSPDSETATMPSLDQGVDASLTQGHDVVQRVTSPKQGSRVWMFVAIALIFVVIALVIGMSRGKLTRGLFGSAPAESNSSITESGSGDSQITEDSTQPNSAESDTGNQEVSKGGQGKESNPSGSD